ncbi:MAG: hypothetical protein ACRD3V_25655 [Vicinamibacteria bacterium]
MESFIGRVARQALREPTLHFALAAALLFSIGTAVSSFRPPIVAVEPGEIELRIRQLERGRGTPLSNEERKIAETAYIDEQILATEARTRGLDDDARIRGILYQKMLHVLSSEVPQPTDGELRAYYEETCSRYARRSAVTVEDVVIESGLDPEASAREGRRPNVLTRVTEGELAWSFGEGTAAMVFGAEPGRWVGPHISADGEHWFRVVERIDAEEAPPFETIREQVRFDWMAEKEEALLQQRMGEIRQRYRVRYRGEGSTP